MKITILFLFILFPFIIFPQTVSAHDLIPQAVIEYIKEHPNATAQEIEQIAKTTSSKESIQILKNKEKNIIVHIFDFIKLGIQHILSGPDHILFVISLLLVFVSIKDILKLVSVFTVAHSTTLILAGTGLLILNSKIVEPMIAFSISYVAITSIFFKKFIGTGKSKIAAVFFFGLFHGLGFAGFLKEIKIPHDRFLLSLLSFNIGIELGQLLIVGALLPLIYIFQNKKWYEMVIKIIAGIIGVLGVIWGIQRLIVG